ncbi:hypothetical protein B0T25DRAFT_634395 [Lasiosphaeria hispida]|uniref:Uncharacterized protein n=1 Tax=Lasiosphaeria hispida TaxID=260671 RepID=A0AAJ0HDB0_9PEZI|nr:hypothetical protein B0T25DRAFT_634395 [Lasiosphaeria hispida]
MANRLNSPLTAVERQRQQYAKLGTSHSTTLPKFSSFTSLMLRTAEQPPQEDSENGPGEQSDQPSLKGTDTDANPGQTLEQAKQLPNEDFEGDSNMESEQHHPKGTDTDSSPDLVVKQAEQLPKEGIEARQDGDQSSPRGTDIDADPSPVLEQDEQHSKRDAENDLKTQSERASPEKAETGTDPRQELKEAEQPPRGGIEASPRKGDSDRSPPRKKVADAIPKVIDEMISPKIPAVQGIMEGAEQAQGEKGSPKNAEARRDNAPTDDLGINNGKAVLGNAPERFDWADDIPTEEEQIRRLKEQNESWTTVSSKKESKGKEKAGALT